MSRATVRLDALTPAPSPSAFGDLRREAVTRQTKGPARRQPFDRMGGGSLLRPGHSRAPRIPVARRRMARSRQFLSGPERTRPQLRRAIGRGAPGCRRRQQRRTDRATRRRECRVAWKAIANRSLPLSADAEARQEPIRAGSRVACAKREPGYAFADDRLVRIRREFVASGDAADQRSSDAAVRAACRPLPGFVHFSSERTLESVRKACSFAERQQPQPARLLVVVQSGNLMKPSAGCRSRRRSGLHARCWRGAGASRRQGRDLLRRERARRASHAEDL